LLDEARRCKRPLVAKQINQLLEEVA